MSENLKLDSFTQFAEDFWENQVIFRARWLLAPAYLFLVFALAVLTYKTGEEFFELLLNLHQYDESRATAQILVIVDIILVMNLILMVLFVGYANFVSVIHPDKQEDWPKWMGYLDYSGLKIQLIGSIIAISRIKLLRVFVDITEAPQVDTNRIILMIALHVTFLLSALVLAVVNKLKDKSSVEH